MHRVYKCLVCKRNTDSAWLKKDRTRPVCTDCIEALSEPSVIQAVYGGDELFAQKFSKHMKEKYDLDKATSEGRFVPNGVKHKDDG